MPNISTRLFAPAELARVSMFGTYTSLFCSVCYLGLDQAFVRFFRETPGRMTPRALLTFCLSTIIGADNIVVVKDGTVHAQGTHEKLLETCPLYRDMWQAHIGAKDQM